MSLTENLHLLLPEFLLAALALLVFAIDLFLPDRHKNLLAWMSAAGLAGLVGLSIPLLWGEDAALYGGLLAVDAYALFFKVMFMVMGIFVILALGGLRRETAETSRRILRHRPLRRSGDERHVRFQRASHGLHRP